MKQVAKLPDVQNAAASPSPQKANSAITILRKSRLAGGRSNSIVMFGVDFEVTKNLEWRVTWAQRGAILFSCIMVFGLVFQNSQVERMASIAVLSSLILFYYNNMSFVIMKRLLRESNVIILILFSVLNVAIEIFTPTDAWSWYHALWYAGIVVALIMNDAAVVSTRPFILFLMLLFIGITIYNIYARIFLSVDLGVIWIEYKVRGEPYSIEKRSVQRTIFVQLLIASLQAVSTMVYDKNMELMMFAYGPIYKKSGTSKRDDFPRQDVRQKKRAKHRNSWSESFRSLKRIYRESMAISKSSTVMGINRKLDNALERRVVLCQNGIILFVVITAVLFALSQSNEDLKLACVACASPAIVLFAVLSYDNISFAVIKRLLRELNVLAIIGLSICLIIAEALRPSNPYSVLLACVYTLVVILFVMFDAIIIKSRIFFLFFGTISFALLIYNAYQSVFGTWESGVILAKYNIGKEEGKISKRFVMFSIYIQTLIFSFNGFCNAFEDREMKLLIFATGNIYKSTGTASSFIHDEKYSVGRSDELQKIESSRCPEKKVSMV